MNTHETAGLIFPPLVVFARPQKTKLFNSKWCLKETETTIRFFKKKSDCQTFAAIHNDKFDLHNEEDTYNQKTGEWKRA